MYLLLATGVAQELISTYFFASGCFKDHELNPQLQHDQGSRETPGEPVQLIWTI